MPRKIDLLQEVYQTQLATLTYSREVWCSFLRTAAFQYKYSFSDQVLIWSQPVSYTHLRAHGVCRT